jgi:chaperonin GroEL
MRHIVNNAGEEGSVVIEQVRNGKGSYGFDASTNTYGDMIEMGIIDPAKVTRVALQAAGSIAGLMLTTEVTISDMPAE